jgi:hypothetical protein
VPPASVPRPARVAHGQDELARLEAEGAPDLVLRYQKSVTLYTDRVFRLHQRANSVNEILRFSVQRFLHRMDEPRKALVPPPAGALAELPALTSVAAPKTYIVGLAIGVRSGKGPGDEGHWARFRLVLTREGIQRIEPDEGGV